MRVVYMLFWRFEIVLLRKYITLHRLKDQICASFWDQVNIYPFGQFLNPQTRVRHAHPRQPAHGGRTW